MGSTPTPGTRVLLCSCRWQAWHRADVLRALARPEEVDEALRVGIAAFERKGFQPSAQKLRRLLSST